MITRALPTSLSGIIASLALVAVMQPAAVEAQPPTYQFILLHPSGFTNSVALGISDGQQVSGAGWSQASKADERALLWGGAGTQVTSLNPGSTSTSEAWAVSGTGIAGIVRAAGTPDSERATLWLANGSTRITLTPPGFAVTFAYDVSDGLVVGNGAGPATSTAQHALLWTAASASSAVDLNPGQLGYVFSRAWGVDSASGQQVGSGNYLLGFGSYGQDRALLWTGTAESAVELHPDGFDSSEAIGTAGAAQVGWGIPAGGSNKHALLWRGTAASVVDLHPSTFTESQAYRVRGNWQAGEGFGPSTQQRRHALVWQGTAASAVNLHPFLPGQYAESVALAVDRVGHVVGFAVTAQGEHHAVLWQRVPELLSLSFPDGSLTQGNRFARIRVKLDGPAPSGDAVVALASSNPSVAAVPSSGDTTVPSGLDATIDGVWVTAVSSRRQATVTASFNGASRSAVLTVDPARLKSLKFSPEQVPGCQSAIATVFLDGAAPPLGATVAISGSPRIATWPSRVTVPAGADRVSFSVAATKTPGVLALTANYAGKNVGNTLTILAPAGPCPKK